MEFVVVLFSVVIVVFVGYAIGRIESMSDYKDILLEGNKAVEKKLNED